MAKDFKLLGIATVMKNLTKAVEQVEQKTIQGLISAAIIIRRDMEKTGEGDKIPVDLGNLRASCFISSVKGSKSEGQFEGPDAGKLAAEHSAVTSAAEGAVQQNRKPMVIIGFSANYAVFVHENTEAKNWNRRGSGPKFLEHALDRNRSAVLTELQKHAKL